MRKQGVVLVLLVLCSFVLLSAAPATRSSAQTRQTSPVRTPTRTSTPILKPTATATVTPTATPVTDRLFPETGFTVPAAFVRYWVANGGLPVFGYPLTAAVTEKSKTDGQDYLVQYFERNRFEYHPEFSGTNNEVLLGLLGAELTRSRTFQPADPIADTETQVYMAPTRHVLAEPFLTYWKNNGGLAIFGYPISEVFQEVNNENGKTYAVQYFQRNRFEYHPENKPPHNVLLGLLGRDLLDLKKANEAWGPPIPGGLTPVDAIWPATRPVVGTTFLKGPAVGDGMIVQAYYQNRDRIFNMINDLDYKWVKQQVEWKDTENPKGTYFWEEIDKIVNNALQHNVKVLLTVVKAPTWATGGFNGLPKDPQDFGDFLYAMAAHFKGRVSAYEVWNEQNLFGETGDVNPGRFVELMKLAYIGIKAADPDAIVVSGALSPTGVNDPLGKRAPGAMGAIPDTVFLEQMYLYHDGEVRRYFDALGSHPYGFNNPPDTKWPDNPNWNPAFPLAADGKQDYYNRHNSFYFRRIEEQRAIMEKYGDGQKQMWITEYGWCSDMRPDGYGECKYNTPEQQGEYVVRTIQRARQYYPWMGVMFVWNLNFATVQEWYTGPAHFGIINSDWSARPAYFIIKNRPALLRSR